MSENTTNIRDMKPPCGNFSLHCSTRFKPSSDSSHRAGRSKVHNNEFSSLKIITVSLGQPPRATINKNQLSMDQHYNEKKKR